MNVSEIMSPNLVTVDVGASVDVAVQQMDAEGVRHLIVTHGGELQGLVSDRDMLGVVDWDGTASGRPLRDLVSRDLATIGPDARVAAAAAQLVSFRVGCLPVVQGDALVGILTEFDVLTVVGRACESGRIEDVPVELIMATDILTVTPGTTFGQAAIMCCEHDIRHIPVVDEELLVGIVSDRDLRAAAGRGEAGDTPVARLMTTRVVSLGPSDTVSLAAQLCVTQRISSLPILIDDRLVGLVTTTDLLAHAARALPAA